MKTKRWIAISGIFLGICMLVLLACAAISEYWSNQQAQLSAEARDAGYNQRISARLYSIEQYRYNGETYYLVNYGNKDMFGGSYSDYALLPMDTIVHKSIKEDRWMLLYYRDSQAVDENFSIDGHPEYCEILDAYMIFGEYELPVILWLGAILGAIISGGTCVVSAIILGIQCCLRKRKQGGEEEC